jgi:hypothetical protein
MIATLLLHIRKIFRYIYSVSQYYKNTKVALFLLEFRIAGVPSKICTFQIIAHKLK